MGSSGPQKRNNSLEIALRTLTRTRVKGTMEEDLVQKYQWTNALAGTVAAIIKDDKLSEQEKRQKALDAANEAFDKAKLEDQKNIKAFLNALNPPQQQLEKKSDQQVNPPPQRKLPQPPKAKTAPDKSTTTKIITYVDISGNTINNPHMQKLVQNAVELGLITLSASGEAKIDKKAMTYIELVQSETTYLSKLNILQENEKNAVLAECKKSAPQLENDLRNLIEKLVEIKIAEQKLLLKLWDPNPLAWKEALDSLQAKYVDYVSIQDVTQKLPNSVNSLLSKLPRSEPLPLVAVLMELIKRLPPDAVESIQKLPPDDVKSIPKLLSDAVLMELIQRLRLDDPLMESMQKESMQKLPLDAVLMEPIQRGMRFRMLLGEVQKALPERAPLEDQVNEALAAAVEFADAANKGKALSEDKQSREALKEQSEAFNNEPTNENFKKYLQAVKLSTLSQNEIKAEIGKFNFSKLNKKQITLCKDFIKALEKQNSSLEMQLATHEKIKTMSRDKGNVEKEIQKTQAAILLNKAISISFSSAVENAKTKKMAKSSILGNVKQIFKKAPIAKKPTKQETQPIPPTTATPQPTTPQSSTLQATTSSPTTAPEAPKIPFPKNPPQTTTSGTTAAMQSQKGRPLPTPPPKPTAPRLGPQASQVPTKAQVPQTGVASSPQTQQPEKRVPAIITNCETHTASAPHLTHPSVEPKKKPPVPPRRNKPGG